MPHPKNRLKLTGDTHLPDVGFEAIAEERLDLLMRSDEEEPPQRVYADGWVPPPQESAADPELAPQPQGKAEAAVQTVERLEARSPWLAIGIGIGLGWLIASMIRAMQRH